MQVDIKSIEPFDVAKGTTVYYSWGGDPIYQVRLIIKTTTGSEVETITVPEDAPSTDPILDWYIIIESNDSHLTNGKTYEAFIQVATASSPTSEKTWSDVQSTGMRFKCIQTPTLEYTSVPGDHKLTTSHFTFEATYTYEKNVSEPLKEWRMDIYDNTKKTVVLTTGTQYSTSSALSVPLRFPCSGFNSGSEYEVRTYAITKSGMELDCIVYAFSQQIPASDQFYILDPKNVDCDGAIQVNTHIAIIDGFLYYPPGRFMKNSKGKYDYLSLRHNGLYYKSGFNLDGDFVLSMLAADLDSDEEICFLTDSVYNKQTETYGDMSYRISINYMEGYFGETFIPPHEDEEGNWISGDYSEGEKKGMFELVVCPKTQSMVQEVEHYVDYEDFYEKKDSTYYSKGWVYYSNLIDPVEPEEFVRVNVLRKTIPLVTDPDHINVWWEIVASKEGSDEEILMSHEEMSEYTHKYLSGYTHREIRSEKPIDCVEKGG